MLERNGGQSTNVAAIGDAAFTVSIPKGQAIIVLAKNDVVYSITIVDARLNATALQRALRRLASDALRIIATTAPSLPVPHPHPCTLVTPDEASQRGSVQWLFTANSAGVGSCDYISALGVQKRIQVIITNNADLASNIYSAEERVTQQAQSIKGLATAAFYDTSSSSVWVFKGNSVFHISMLGVASPEQTLEQLARRAAGRF